MASKKAQKIAESLTRSARLKAVKTLWMNQRRLFFMPDAGQPETFTRNLNSPALWDALWNQVHYRIPAEMLGYGTEGERRNVAIRILHSDLESVLAFSENRMWDLYRLALLILPLVAEQSVSDQKRLQKTLWTFLKMSQVNDTINVGASQRARVAFQKEAFGSSFKLVDQNKVLQQLAAMGLGFLDSGSSYESGKLPQLSVMKLSYLDADAEVEDYPIISSLVSVGLLKSLVEENPIDSLSCYQQFCLVMDHLDPAAKAFKMYCDSKSTEYKAVRDEFKAANPLPPKEEKPKKTYKPRKINLSKLERKFVEQGKAEVINNEFVWVGQDVEAPATYNPESLLDVDVLDIGVRMNEIFAERTVMTPARLDAITAGLEF